MKIILHLFLLLCAGAVGAVAEPIYQHGRYEPGTDLEPRWEDHRVEVSPGMTVLDGLWKVKEMRAPDLAWRSSCRMGVWGSCGMLINGKARLACNTQVTELGGDTVVVAPLPNFDIVRVLTAGGPLNSTHIFGTWAFRVGIEGGDIPLGAAVSLFMVPILAVAATFILRDITKRGSEV